MSIIKSWNPSNPEQDLTRANQQYCCPTSITDVPLPDGNAGKCLKYLLNKTDAVMSGSVRAELQLSPGSLDAQTGLTWYGIRYWFEKYDSDGGAESILQWHDTDGTTPPLSIQVASGRLNICQSFKAGNIHTDLGPVVLGKWVEIQLGVLWSQTTTGSIEAWRDGKQYMNKTGIRTNSSGGSYLKLGINKWSWGPGGQSDISTQRILYIDGFELGTTRADVMPGNVVPPVNQSPLVNAGIDQTINEGDVLQLTGNVSDPDGSISSVLWTGSGVIAKPNVAVTSVSGLTAGTYTFSLKATDNQGASTTDQMVVTVKPIVIPPPKPRMVTKVVLTYDDNGTQTLP